MTDLVRYLDPINHARRKHPVVNTLFKDGHVTLCGSTSVWSDMESTALPEIAGNYRISKLIGGQPVTELAISPWVLPRSWGLSAFA